MISISNRKKGCLELPSPTPMKLSNVPVLVYASEDMLLWY